MYSETVEVPADFSSNESTLSTKQSTICVHAFSTGRLPAVSSFFNN